MGERLLCKQEVVGSIPSASTIDVMVERTANRPGCEDRWRDHNTDTWTGTSASRSFLCLSPLGARRDHGQVKMMCK